MAVLRLDIPGNPKTLPFRTMLSVGGNAMGVLEDLDHAFSHTPALATEWLMNDLGMNGALRIEIYSVRRTAKRTELPDVGKRVAESFVDGFKSLEIEGKSPAYLTDAGMHRAEKMTKVIATEQAPALIASIPEAVNEAVAITRKSVENLKRLLPASASSLGSVEGDLEGINLHGRRPRFIVYERRTGKAVTCWFPGEMKDTVIESLQERVIVSGRLARNARGEPVNIKLISPEGLKIFGKDLKVLPFKKLGGSDPDFTGDLSTEDFIRSIRG